jgi:transcriptional regulator with XRE-family HTH domain
MALGEGVSYMARTEFGRWLHESIRTAGIRNQADLAERLNVGPSTVSMWARGEREPDPDNIEALARVLGVSVVRVYEALGRMTQVTDAEYRDWVELLKQVDSEVREEGLSYLRWRIAERAKQDRVCSE